MTISRYLGVGFTSALLSLAAACTGMNPDYLDPASIGVVATNGRPNPNQPTTACPVASLDKTANGTFAFYSDGALCPNLVSLPADGQPTTDNASYWMTFEAARPIAFVSQPFATASSAPWIFQPGNKSSDQVTNQWHLIDTTTTSVYSALASGGQQVGFNLLKVDPVLRTVSVTKCPNNGMPGFCYPW